MKSYLALAAVVFAVLASAYSVAAKQEDKVTICHVPPGNPPNAHTIIVGESAVPAHLAHGDSLGACVPDQSNPR